MDQKEFHNLADQIAEEFTNETSIRLENVAICVEEIPTPEQMQKTGVRHGNMLMGLYEGVPETTWGKGLSITLPDKITLFQTAIEQYAAECAKSIREVIKDVIWHEIAHHKGYDDQELEEMELKRGITG